MATWRFTRRNGEISQLWIKNLPGSCKRGGNLAGIKPRRAAFCVGSDIGNTGHMRGKSRSSFQWVLQQDWRKEGGQINQGRVGGSGKSLHWRNHRNERRERRLKTGRKKWKKDDDSENRENVPAHNRPLTLLAARFTRHSVSLFTKSPPQTNKHLMRSAATPRWEERRPTRSWEPSTRPGRINDVTENKRHRPPRG